MRSAVATLGSEDDRIKGTCFMGNVSMSSTGRLRACSVSGEATMLKRVDIGKRKSSCLSSLSGFSDIHICCFCCASMISFSLRYQLSLLLWMIVPVNK